MKEGENMQGTIKEDWGASQSLTLSAASNSAESVMFFERNFGLITIRLRGDATNEILAVGQGENDWVRSFTDITFTCPLTRTVTCCGSWARRR